MKSTSSIVTNASKQHKAFVLQPSASTRVQQETELECQPFFINLHELSPHRLEDLRATGLIIDDSLDLCVLYDKHVGYLQQSWKDDSSLKWNFSSLDASRTWMIYWTLQGCDLLNKRPSETECESIVEFLASCWSEQECQFPRALGEQIAGVHDSSFDSIMCHDNDRGNDVEDKVTLVGGGFGGGPSQIPHAATNYAAILALCIISTDSAVALLKQCRKGLSIWMPSLLTMSGGMRMHHDGEIDARATYCVMVVAKLLNIRMPREDKMIAFMASCQTFEGGFGGEPFAEAHGGYTFCAIAALWIMKGLSSIDVAAATGWLVRRQLSLEGGFNGRANKLVDGCYSFWQGGAIAIMSSIADQINTEDYDDPWLSNTKTVPDLLFDAGMLQRYILLCAQEVNGGLRDKPSKQRDFYHSCYNLCGLSVSQYSGIAFGHEQLSRVAQTHPVYNIRLEHVRRILSIFQELEP